jgi:hypothetical protein
MIVKETPDMLKRILELLDSMKTVENKKVLLRVIGTLAESIENKLEIGAVKLNTHTLHFFSHFFFFFLFLFSF